MRMPRKRRPGYSGSGNKFPMTFKEWKKRMIAGINKITEDSYNKSLQVQTIGYNLSQRRRQSANNQKTANQHMTNAAQSHKRNVQPPE